MVNNDPMAYVGQLATVPADAILYEVFALDKPTEMGGKSVHIGSLELDG